MVNRTEAELDEVLAEVAAASEHVDAARHRLWGSVRRARARGASYADIGRTLGVTRQAAWERFTKGSGPDAS